MAVPEPEHDAWTHHDAIVNGIRLHYVEAGEGPLVVLLHGFPSFWRSWRHQIPALAAAGFRVVAPDMRGYNASEKPPGVRSYGMEALTADVAGLIRHAGVERASVVGHDWGGAISWYMPMRYPDLVDKLIVLNAPHPAAWAREIRRPAQLGRALYQFFFQVPWLPEAILRARNYAAIRRGLRRAPVRPGAFGEEEIRRYVAAIGQPGALTAALNYYRAAFRQALRRGRQGMLAELRRIDAPTLLIWGEQDPVLTVELTEGLETWVPSIRVERLPHASHFVHIDRPDEVNAKMLAFLSDGVR
jgi:pimeloyl-ACP methyl ester carboxylesterase